MVRYLLRRHVQSSGEICYYLTCFNEVKDALLAAIDKITQTLFQLKKAFEEYYFPDKDQVSWRVSHDV
jgi:hypothetical protein